jgi:orotate phosphoribosyltransferase
MIAPARQALAARIHALAHLRGDFLLRSGARSTQYFDKYRFEADPGCLRAVAEGLAELLPPGSQPLAGLELGGVPLATVLGQITGRTVLFVRKQAKGYGTCKLAEGPDFAGQELVLVEDVITSGGAVLEAAAALRAGGATVQSVVAVIDRDAGGRAALAAAGLELACLFDIHELNAAAAGDSQNTGETR